MVYFRIAHFSCTVPLFLCDTWYLLCCCCCCRSHIDLSIAIMHQSVVTGQAPITLQRKITSGGKRKSRMKQTMSKSKSYAAVRRCHQGQGPDWREHHVWQFLVLIRKLWYAILKYLICTYEKKCGRDRNEYDAASLVDVVAVFTINHCFYIPKNDISSTPSFLLIIHPTRTEMLSSH